MMQVLFDKLCFRNDKKKKKKKVLTSIKNAILTVALSCGIRKFSVASKQIKTWFAIQMQLLHMQHAGDKS